MDKANEMGHEQLETKYKGQYVTRLECSRKGCGCSVIICHDSGMIQGTALSRPCEDRENRFVDEYSGLGSGDIANGLGLEELKREAKGNEARQW